MSATYIGSSDVIVSETYGQSNDGVSTYEQKKLYGGNTAVSGLPQIGDSVNGFRVIGVSLIVTDGAFSEVIIRGESTGTAGGGSGGFGSGQLLSDATNSTSEEPITTSPNFISSANGLPSIIDSAGGAVTQGQAVTDGTGSIFSADGEFLGFTKNAKSNLGGVQSYLNPTLSHRRRFSTTSEPSISAVGRIVNPAGDFPAIESGRTWLCTNISYTLRGDNYEVTQEFRASGRQGWSEYIYGPPVSAPSTS